MTGRRKGSSEALREVEGQIRLTDAVESVDRLQRAVTACQREVANLMVLHGFTWTDVARVTELDVNAAKALSRRSRAARDVI